MIHEEGLPSVYARHEAMAATRARARARRWGSSHSFPSSTGARRRSPRCAHRPACRRKSLKDGLKQRGILVAGGLGAYSDRGDSHWTHGRHSRERRRAHVRRARGSAWPRRVRRCRGRRSARRSCPPSPAWMRTPATSSSASSTSRSAPTRRRRWRSTTSTRWAASAFAIRSASSFALDHYAPPTSAKTAALHDRVRAFARAHGIHLWEMGDGIGLQLMVGIRTLSAGRTRRRRGQSLDDVRRAERRSARASEAPISPRR